MDSCFHLEDFEVSSSSTMQLKLDFASHQRYTCDCCRLLVEIVVLPPLSYLWPQDRVREYVDLGLKDCFEHQSRGDYLSFLGVIGSVEKFPLVDLQLYFLIYKPEFTWNYDGI